jgi:hypothetical protein
MTSLRALVLGLLCVPIIAVGAETPLCIRQVFQDYCLGGTLTRQLEQNPVEMQPRSKGERRGVIYHKDNEKIYVMAYKGIIYKILHTFEPESLVTLRELQRHLQRKYGRYEDRSEYPEETQNKSRQVNYIRRGEGELRYVWQLPGHAWRVELGWTRRLGVTVTYFVNELDEMQEAATLQGL